MPRSSTARCTSFCDTVPAAASIARRERKPPPMLSSCRMRLITDTGRRDQYCAIRSGS